VPICVQVVMTAEHTADCSHICRLNTWVMWSV